MHFNPGVVPSEGLCTMDVDFITAEQLVEAPRRFTAHQSPGFQPLAQGASQTRKNKQQILTIPTHGSLSLTFRRRRRRTT